MRAISLLAIVVGGVSDVVLSSVLGIPFGIYVVTSRGLSQLPRGQLGSALLTAIHGDSLLYTAQLGIGLGCSVLGGFIAASLAKQRLVLNGVLASWLCVGIGVYSLVAGNSATSVPLHLMLIAVTPFCYVLGATVRLKLSRSRGAVV